MATKVCVFNPTTNLIDIMDAVSVDTGNFQDAGKPIVLNSSGNLDSSFTNFYLSAVASIPMAAGSLISLFYATISKITGSVTSGTFTTGEALTQTSSGATATLVGTVLGVNSMFVQSVSGTPDAVHTWVGGTSGAVYTPTSTPVGSTGIYAGLATADSSGVAPAIGYISSAVVAGETVQIFINGLVTASVTGGSFTSSDINKAVYLSTTTPGSVTKTMPTSPNLVQPIGYVYQIGGGFIQFPFQSFSPATTGGTVLWGNISGTLSSQTDLQAALNSKVSAPTLQSKTTSYTMLSTDDSLIMNSSSATTVNLTTSGTATGHIFKVKNNGTGAVTVQGITGTIDGQSSVVLSLQYQSIQLQFDGTNFGLL